MKRSLSILVLILTIASAGCSKDLSSGPCSPPGTPVLLNGTPIVNLSRKVSIKGLIKNQSCFTIYDVRIGMEVYLDDPIFANVVDTSEVKIASLLHGDTASFSTYTMSGDVFIDVFLVYSFLKPASTIGPSDSYIRENKQ